MVARQQDGCRNFKFSTLKVDQQRACREPADSSSRDGARTSVSAFCNILQSLGLRIPLFGPPFGIDKDGARYRYPQNLGGKHELKALRASLSERCVFQIRCADFIASKNEALHFLKMQQSLSNFGLCLLKA